MFDIKRFEKVLETLVREMRQGFSYTSLTELDISESMLDQHYGGRHASNM